VTSVLGITYDGDLGNSGWGLLGNINLSQQGARRTSTNPAPGGVLNPFDEQGDTIKINARVGFSLPDDRASIEFWGLNTPLQGASRSAFVQTPRQYGVTLRTNF